MKRIHASSVRDARLPSDSDWSPGRYAALRSSSLQSIRAAHDGSDAITQNRPDNRAVFVHFYSLHSLPVSGIMERTQKEGNDMRQLTPLFFKAPGLGAYRFYFHF